MNNNSKQVIPGIRVYCIVRRVLKDDLHGKHDTIAEFLVLVQLLDELEALQVYHQYRWQLLYLHPLLGLLKGTALVTVELVATGEGLDGREVEQAVRQGAVLLHVNAQVQERLVLGSDALAGETLSLVGESTLEDVVDEGTSFCVGITLGRGSISLSVSLRQR